jgi:16S rRNA (guanine527-N7)-methyltransferase
MAQNGLNSLAQSDLLREFLSRNEAMIQRHQPGLVSDPARLAALMAAFDTLQQELLRWNAQVNLTAITAPEEIVIKHFIDSIIPLGRLTPPLRVIDAGCGAGFPGLPLKLISPGLDITLVDSNRKKIFFVRHMIRQLQLEDTAAVQATLSPAGIGAKLSDYRPERLFDLFISRAVWKLSESLAYACNYIHDQGQIIALKGPEGERELAESQTFMQQAGLVLRSYESYQLPGRGDRRCLIHLEFHK